MHVHILGIGGTFMAGIAALARARGHRVTGSDRALYPPMSTQLAALGVEIIEGYDNDRLEPAPDCVVVGNVMRRGMPVVERLLDSGLAYCSGPEWLARELLHERWTLAVAGTHGKTTTTSILAFLLDAAGLEPGFLVGGIPADFGVSARLGAAPFFVVEADEYDTAFFDKRSKFVHYRPRTLVLGNLEFDHADIFDDLGAIQRQFHHLVRTVPGSGLIVSKAGDAALEEVLAQGCWTPVERFSGPGQAPPQGAHAARLVPGGFEVIDPAGDVAAVVQWSMPGAHNAENGLAAMLAARHAGVPLEVSARALARFRGVKRRQEWIGTAAGVELYDDFAHHPTAIARTLEAMHGGAEGRRLVAVLEPRSNTMRMGVHAAALAPSLAAADAVYVYAPAELDWDAAGALGGLGERVRVCAALEELEAILEADLRPGDRVVVMSNGSFGGLHGRLLHALQTREQGGKE
ncbi:UDP-N-acetylmuramate:L-alanyl-gamma-D-glutamyl-meso-diaminopimelate ligase [Thioalkalivibrio sp. XN279]|uniref:UDP-N-acetylmuramate:L-alanyl-gamma-D-glutamyl- meso-diaminopimelate ligase n=1 Tax=Thioalkalivibrio sp. XN279 TaxID=2714953 RepID=UPI00140E4EA4|nr:UDP-N-acetylmuramate:L-alanyl-gamma-D-glutamyl-meso-diaminopimelate ligase [Thioalkalivibrio sp. XN279]NHA16126.1 UDP-N-acetylmuramate:L-alanyl-gamma-D-glutamyl-meso-diaminopimelate ligase [Thioalkalivibrio sp. XN279]